VSGTEAPPLHPGNLFRFWYSDLTFGVCQGVPNRQKRARARAGSSETHPARARSSKTSPHHFCLLANVGRRIQSPPTSPQPPSPRPFYAIFGPQTAQSARARTQDARKLILRARAPLERPLAPFVGLQMMVGVFKAHRPPPNQPPDPPSPTIFCYF